MADEVTAVAGSHAAGGIDRWKAILLILAVPVMLVVVLVNLLWGGRVEPDPWRRIANALGSRNHAVAAGENRALVQANPRDLKLRRGCLEAHFAQPKHVGRNPTIYAFDGDELLILVVHRRDVNRLANPGL